MFIILQKMQTVLIPTGGNSHIKTAQECAEQVACQHDFEFKVPGELCMMTHIK